MADSISIEEANKIRAAMGMKLLPTSNGTSNLNFKPSDRGEIPSGDGDKGSTLDTREAAGYDNWKKLQDEAAATKMRQSKRETVKKERDAAQRFSKLQGQGLGDAVEVDGDTRAWLLASKKRQRKIDRERASKFEQERIEQEQQAQYTDKDLAGKTVGHELGEFEDGEQILTLKDAPVDAEDDEDELENIDMKEKEKLKEKLELKKKKPIYDPNEVDENGQKTLLGQYDEETEGKKQKRFTLNGTGMIDSLLGDRQGPDGAMGAQGMQFSLDFAREAKPVSDYLDASEIKIRKPKKAKNKSKKRKAEDDDDIFPDSGASALALQVTDAIDIELPISDNIAVTRASFTNTSFMDDEDLQSNLAHQRRAALKNRKKMRPEDLAKQLREDTSAALVSMDIDKDEEGGLILDETSEFVSNLKRPEAPAKRRASSAKQSTLKAEVSASPEANAEADVEMQESYNDVEEEEEVETRIKRETSSVAVDGEMTTTGLDDEDTLDRGLGGTIHMLTQRGLMSKVGDGSFRNADDRQRQRFLSGRQKLEAEAEIKARLQRERDRGSGKFANMSNKEREQHAQWENKHRDQQDSRQMAEVFNRDYKPKVNLKYIDEYGRDMNQKEAFKHLSHQFHGKSSGKQKTEKRLKSIDDEKKREAMSSLDSSQATGMNNAMGATARKNRQAGVRLQ